MTEVQAKLVPDTKSGTPGADAVKVKGTSPGWRRPMRCRRRCGLYDRLFAAAQPGGGEDFWTS